MVKNIFDKQVSNDFIDRINRLNIQSKPLWGKMSVDQMLAHCNVSYDMYYEPQLFNTPNMFQKILLKLFVKPLVVGNKPYPRNSKTAPAFIIKGSCDFQMEKATLINNISLTQQLGSAHFEGAESLSFGKLTANEWNTLFYKHLDHHLSQFGV